MARFASGSGDGVITDDGCAVELYRRLRASEDEIGRLTALTPPSGSILDLGAGAGRLAEPLGRAGFAVTAVDQSAEMLAEIGSGVACIQSSIEALQLGPSFDLVLLSSYLLNTPALEDRGALLAACARHLKPAGALAAQVRGPGILRDLNGFERENDGVRDWVESYRRDGSQVTMTMRTEWDGRRTSQTFTQLYLEEASLRRELAAGGLLFERWLDDPPEWCLARRG
jgi:SAM-dependent methyltransferase